MPEAYKATSSCKYVFIRSVPVCSDILEYGGLAAVCQTTANPSEQCLGVSDLPEQRTALRIFSMPQVRRDKYCWKGTTLTILVY